MPGLKQAIHLAVALDGAGLHPAAWREPDARPSDLFTASYWVDVVGMAEQGRIEFVILEDSLGMQSASPSASGEGKDRVRGRMDAVLIAARIAPLIPNIGLVPTVVVSHTEPFHISKAIATLDHITNGRAGMQVRASARKDEADHFGRRNFSRADAPIQCVPTEDSLTYSLAEEAVEYVDVVRCLWDSWEDGADKMGLSADRFPDRDKIHYIDYKGKWLNIRGPSTTSRPPQGQPIVSVAIGQLPHEMRMSSVVDITCISPRCSDDAVSIVAEIKAALETAGRAGDVVHIFEDLVIFLGENERKAFSRKSRLDSRIGEEYHSASEMFIGSSTQLADLLEKKLQDGITGFRLQPGAIPHDLLGITRELVPELQRRGLYRREYDETTLRGLLGMRRTVSRYATGEIAND